MSQIALQEFRQSEPAKPPRTLGARLRLLCAEFWLNYFFFFVDHVPWFVPRMKAFHLGLAIKTSRVINQNTRLNGRRIFGAEATEEKLATYTREVASSFFDFVYDIGRTRGMELPALLDLIESVEGHDKYVAARAMKKGAIIVTAHMGSFEVGMAAILQHDPNVHVVFKRDERCRFEQVRQGLRQRLGVHEIAIDDGWTIWMRVRDALMRDEVIVMQGDRVMPGQKGLPIPVLHGHLLLPNGPIKLAKATGAPIIPVFSIRTPEGKVRIKVEEPIWVDARAEAVDGVDPAMRKMAGVMERYIRTYPGQWLLLQPAFCEDADGRTQEAGS